MSKKILIVGGGIIGICSAYYLSKSGHDVTIIDKYGMNSGASYVNAGYLSPGHIIPLAAPGVIKQGLKWMFNSSSPFYVEPRINLDFLPTTGIVAVFRPGSTEIFSIPNSVMRSTN